MAATGKRNRLAVWLWVAVAVGIGVLYFVPLSLFPKCPLRELTGWNCPGCGATRAAHELVHGHIRAALHLNALFVLAIPGALDLAVEPTHDGSVEFEAGGVVVVIGCCTGIWNRPEHSGRSVHMAGSMSQLRKKSHVQNHRSRL